MTAVIKPLALMCVSIATATSILTPQDAFAQSSAPTGNELELPDGEVSTAPSVSVTVDRSANIRPNCPFDSSDLTTSISNLSFVTPDGEALASGLMSSLSEISAPGGERPLSVICDIRDAANAALRDDGWIATVQIPEQDLVDELRLNIVSAQIVEVRISGEPGPYKEMIADSLSKLQALSPLNERDAERILLNLSDTPGLSLSLGLSPAGGLPGEVIGNLTVDFERYSAFLNARNYNAKRIGRETAYGRFEYYGLTGLADVTYVGAQATVDFDEQIVGQAGHEFGIGSSGWRLGANVTYGFSKPDIANLALETETFIANFEAIYPAIRKANMIADVSLGFDYVDQSTELGPFSLSDDAMRSLYLRGDLSQRPKPLGNSVLLSFDAYAELRQGIDVFGATSFAANSLAQTDGVSASRPFGNAEALVGRGGLDATLALTDRFAVNGRVEGQWTDDPLLNYDEYSVGNLTIGRGYDPGANSGDRAIAGSAEIIAGAYRDGTHNVELFGFYDTVKVENLDPSTPEPSRKLDSVGGGLRYTFRDGLQLEVTYAKPLDRALFTDTEKPPERVLVSLTTKFPALFR